MTVSKLSQIIGQILDTLRFRPFWRLRDNVYTVHLTLTGKLSVDFLFVLIEFFSSEY